MLPLLALLLVAAGNRLGRADGAMERPQSSEQRVVPESRKCCLYIETSTVFTENGIGVLDIRARECLDGIL